MHPLVAYLTASAASPWYDVIMWASGLVVLAAIMVAYLWYRQVARRMPDPDRHPSAWNDWQMTKDRRSTFGLLGVVVTALFAALMGSVAYEMQRAQDEHVRVATDPSYRLRHIVLDGPRTLVEGRMLPENAIVMFATEPEDLDGIQIPALSHRIVLPTADAMHIMRAMRDQGLATPVLTDARGDVIASLDRR
jgi:hypothetical protein